MSTSFVGRHGSRLRPTRYDSWYGRVASESPGEVKTRHRSLLAGFLGISLALLSGRSSAADCDAAARVQPKSPHLGCFTIHVENCTRQDTHLRVRQDGTILFDKIGPGDWPLNEDHGAANL